MKRRALAVGLLLAVAGLVLAACSDDTPVPQVGEGAEGNVRWWAGRDETTNNLTTVVWITSEPWQDAEGQTQRATLVMHCSPSRRVFVLQTGVHQPRLDVTWRIDGGRHMEELWTKPNWTRRGELFPPVSAKMIGDLKGVSRFSITTSATPELVFLLEGALDTPVQPNIDNCGQDGRR